MELLRLEKQHEENTLNLRCRLKRHEGEINSLNLTIEGKVQSIWHIRASLPLHFRIGK